MLARPDGIRRSVQAHNSDLAALCDWVEASALLQGGQEELSKAEVVDALIEQEIYDDQDFCWHFVTDAWREVRRRLSWIGAESPVRVGEFAVTRTRLWREACAYSFCLVLSLAPKYGDWHNEFGPDYTEQGVLFERLVHASMKARFGHWGFTSTGWSGQNTATLNEVVPSLAQALCEDVLSLEKYGGESAKDSGVDLVWHLPFADGRGGFPVYLAQCASGSRWFTKLGDPNLGLWCKLIDFRHPPAKAFALPFALSSGDFSRRSARVGGLLLDRYRLLSVGADGANWMPQELKPQLVSWLQPRVQWILGLDRA